MQCIIQLELENIQENRNKKKRGRPIKIDQEEYKKKSIAERFFSWIESCSPLYADVHKNAIYFPNMAIS